MNSDTVLVGFGFVYKTSDAPPVMWVDLSVNNQSILMSPSLARKIASQLNDFADFVEESRAGDFQGEGEEEPKNDSDSVSE